MSTVNISLPKEQLDLLDRFVSMYGYANRSEFVRSLLRFITRTPEVLEQVTTYPFVVPPQRSVKKIMGEFRKSKKYSPSFLKDLEDGLQGSEYFIK